MNKVYFSNVWEDYNSIKEALGPIKGEVVLTICSSGDNVFNMLSDKAEKVIAVDFNPAQISLAKLKLKIIYQFELSKSINLLEGLENNCNKTISDLIAADKDYQHLSHYNFNKGVNNIGKFETKALPLLRFFIKKCFKDSLSAKVYSKFWLEVLILLSSQKFLYRILLPDLTYRYINVNINESLRNSFEDFFRHNDFSKNWYLQKMYYGKYKTMPPFLQPYNFNYIKKNYHRIVFVEDNILSYLKKCKSNSINKMNFSDIFDWCSEDEFLSILKESCRVLCSDGVIFYRELFVSRNILEKLLQQYDVLSEKADLIRKKDSTPFYHRFVILKKK